MGCSKVSCIVGLVSRLVRMHFSMKERNAALTTIVCHPVSGLAIGLEALLYSGAYFGYLVGLTSARVVFGTSSALHPSFYHHVVFSGSSCCLPSFLVLVAVHPPSLLLLLTRSLTRRLASSPGHGSDRAGSSRVSHLSQKDLSTDHRCICGHKV